MNEKVREFANKLLIESLSKCTEDQVHIFKLMYARKNMNVVGPADTEMQIEDVVRCIPDERMDWAQQQVDRTLSKQS